MELKSYLPVWDKLAEQDRLTLEKVATHKKFKKGTIIHNGADDCTGLFIIISGNVRVYTISDGGREITIYRLFDRDICLFSASCMLKSIQFDLTIETQSEVEAYVIPTDIYKKIMSESAPLANFTNEIMSSRFTDVMWLLDQIMWKSFDSRLAEFLLAESVIENSNVLKITHEEIGNHMGNPREVVTRMLKYFQDEGAIILSRGNIQIIDKNKLTKIIDKKI